LKLFTNADLLSNPNKPINTHGAIQLLSFSGFIDPVGSSVLDDPVGSSVPDDPGVDSLLSAGVSVTCFSSITLPSLSVLVYTPDLLLLVVVHSYTSVLPSVLFTTTLSCTVVFPLLSTRDLLLH
jgi:hypothetical protein